VIVHELNVLSTTQWVVTLFPMSCQPLLVCHSSRTPCVVTNSMNRIFPMSCHPFFIQHALKWNSSWYVILHELYVSSRTQWVVNPFSLNKHFVNLLTGTGWRRCRGLCMFTDHFPQKKLIISGPFAERDLQVKASYVSSPPSMLMLVNWICRHKLSKSYQSHWRVKWIWKALYETFD